MKLKHLFFACCLLQTIAVSGQKAFEGKVVSEVTYRNVPDAMKAYVGNSTMTSYYKKDKSWSQSISTGAKSTASHNSIIIADYTKGEQLSIMEMPSLRSKTATLMMMAQMDPQNETYEKLGEFKDILGHACEKVRITVHSGGTTTINEWYVSPEYTINNTKAIGGQNRYLNLPLEGEVRGLGFGDMVIRVISISEEPVPDALFSLDVPAGFQLTDLRKNGSTVIRKDAEAVTGIKSASAGLEVKGSSSGTAAPSAGSSPGSGAKKYGQYSFSELTNMLDQAVAKEDYDTAALLKAEIDKRPENKYVSKTAEELKKLLEEAVAREDFEAADIIKKELDKKSK